MCIHSFIIQIKEEYIIVHGTAATQSIKLLKEVVVRADKERIRNAGDEDM